MLKVNAAAWLTEGQISMLKEIVCAELVEAWGGRSNLDSLKLIELNNTLHRAYLSLKDKDKTWDAWLDEDALLLLYEVVNKERNNAMFGSSFGNANPTFKQVDSLLNVIRSKCSNLKGYKMRKLPDVRYCFESGSITASPPVYNGDNWVPICLDLKRQIDELKQAIENKDAQKPCDSQNAEIKASRIYKSVTYTTDFDAKVVLNDGLEFGEYNIRIDYNVCLDDNSRYFVINLASKMEKHYFKSIMYQDFDQIGIEHTFIGTYRFITGESWGKEPHECAGSLAAPNNSKLKFLLPTMVYVMLKNRHDDLKQLADDEVRRHVHG